MQPQAYLISFVNRDVTYTNDGVENESVQEMLSCLALRVAKRDDHKQSSSLFLPSTRSLSTALSLSLSLFQTHGHLHAHLTSVRS